MVSSQNHNLCVDCENLLFAFVKMIQFILEWLECRFGRMVINISSCKSEDVSV